jgi:hypothetical protein
MKHIWTALRFISDNLQPAINNFISLQGKNRQIRLRETVEPVMLGASLILGISLLERLVSDLKSQKPHSGASPNPNIPYKKLQDWQSYLNLNPNWYGWHELANFYRLRHCFAHEFGRLSNRQMQHVNNFLKKLLSGSILDENRKKISGYYKIVRREIIIKPEALGYFRRLCKNFIILLKHSGLKIPS